MFSLILTSSWLAEFEKTASFLPFPGKYLLMSIIAAPLIFGYSIPVRGLFDLRKISISQKSIKKIIENIKDRMNYPIWHASGICGLLLSSIIIFVIMVSV